MRFRGENKRSQNNPFEGSMQSKKFVIVFLQPEKKYFLDGLTVYRYLPSYASDTFTDSVVMASEM